MVTIKSSQKLFTDEEISRLHHPGSNELLFLALDFPVIVADHAMASAIFVLRTVSLFKAVKAPAVIDSHVKPLQIRCGGSTIKFRIKPSPTFASPDAIISAIR